MSDYYTSLLRQTKAMVVKNLKLKRRMSGQLLWEVLFPAIVILYLRFALSTNCTKESSQCTEEEKINELRTQGIGLPVIFVLMVPSIF